MKRWRRWREKWRRAGEPGRPRAAWKHGKRALAETAIYLAVYAVLWWAFGSGVATLMWVAAYLGYVVGAVRRYGQGLDDGAKNAEFAMEEAVQRALDTWQDRREKAPLN